MEEFPVNLGKRRQYPLSLLLFNIRLDIKGCKWAVTEEEMQITSEQ